MADISSYPQATPKGSDRVLGVQAYVEGDDSTAVLVLVLLFLIPNSLQLIQ